MIMKSVSATLPAVIVLDGDDNALSVARYLGRRGIPVYAINRATARVQYSRYCRWLPVEDGGPREDAWARFLFGSSSDHLAGSVLLTCSDAGLVFIARHRAELAKKFLLDESNPEAQIQMLNKLSTYQNAVAAGIPTPRFWVAGSIDEVRQVKDELLFPLIIKPLATHVFFQRFQRKFVTVENYEELFDAYRGIRADKTDVMLVEKIPGPDSLLSSYYTYLDEHGNSLFDFTKRIVRRFPCSMGAGCYHVTDSVPELKPLALKLFRHVALRGLANVEFKHDLRDGQFKLIECNARFTAANCLVAKSGYDLPSFVYNRVTGRPIEPLETYRKGLRLWYPVEDLWSFLELHRRGELNLWQWIRTLCHPKIYPVFSWDDPWPSITGMFRRLGMALQRLLPAKSTTVTPSSPLPAANDSGDLTGGCVCCNASVELLSHDISAGYPMVSHSEALPGNRDA